MMRNELLSALGIALALTTRMDGQAEGKKELLSLECANFSYTSLHFAAMAFSLSVVIVVEGRREKGAHVDIGDTGPEYLQYAQ